MDALFVVPALVSNNVNEKIVPALAKLVERNIAINNYGLFDNASRKAYKTSAVKRLFRMENQNLPYNIPTYILNENLISEDIIFDILNEAKPNIDPDVMNNIRDTIFSERQREADRRTNDWINSQPSAPTRQQIEAERARILNTLPGLSAKDLADATIKLQQLPSDKERRAALNRIYDQTRTRRERKLDFKTNKAEIKQISQEIKRSAIQMQKDKEEVKILKQRQRQVGKVFGKELSWNPTKTMTSVDQLELPRNIVFFNQVSLEPTIIEIPLEIGTPGGKEFISNEKLVKIGIKCVPYRISSASSLVKLLKMSKFLTDVNISSYMARYFNLIIRKIWQSIPFTKTRDLYKGGQIDPDRSTDAVIYSPNSRELTSSYLATNFKNPGSSPWSTMIILSSFDFKNEPELLDVIKNYRQMTKYVIGDLVITNETKETAYFCGVKIGNCQEFSFEYLKKLLNLSNIIDASASTRHRASAFAFMKGGKNKSFNAAVTESVDPVKYINDIFMK